MLYPHYAQQQSANVFIGSDAKIKQAALQKSFIENKANEKSLMQIVQSKASNSDQKNLALYKTLQKSLVHQNFKLFNQAFVLLPQDAAKYKYDSETYKNSLYTTNFIGPLSYQAFSFLKLLALS